MEEENTTNGRRLRKRILIVLAMCTLVAIGAIAIWQRDKEPQYQGRKLSEWIDFDPPVTFTERLKRIVSRPQQQLAIEHIGTNGLPWFAKWMSYDTPKWKRAFLQSKYAKTAPKSVMRFIMKPIIRADQSREQLVFLGSNSVPYLVPIMDRYPSDSSQAAVRALGQIGQSALPPLLGVATNRTKPIQFRRLVLDAISPRNSSILGGPVLNDPSSLVPILLPCLHENGLEDSTIRLLGTFVFTADTAFQAFTNGIIAKNVDVRIAAVRWAALLRSNAPRATPELIKCFNDADLGVRKAATNALEKIAPEVLTNSFSLTDH